MPLTFRTHSVKNANARDACSCGGHANHDDYSGRATPGPVSNIEQPYSMNDELVRQGKMTPQRAQELSDARDRTLARDDARHQYAQPTTVPSIDTVDLASLLPPPARR